MMRIAQQIIEIENEARKLSWELTHFNGLSRTEIAMIATINNAADLLHKAANLSQLANGEKET